jgi:hypothetical protein
MRQAEIRPVSTRTARGIAWLQGCHAAKMGMPKAANPYSRADHFWLYQCWRVGYRVQERSHRQGAS